METREAFQLLTLASARDGRTVDAAVATVWADDLAEVSLADGVTAARAHYRESSDWLMPAHILRWVRHQSPTRAVTMSPAVSDCGKHRWFDDGTCNFCETRRDADV